MLRLRQAEPLDDESRRYAADIRDRCELLCVGCYQCVKIFKAPGKHLCGFLPYLTYAKGAEKPGKSGGFAALDGGDEIGSGLIPHALKLSYLILLKII